MSNCVWMNGEKNVKPSLKLGAHKGVLHWMFREKMLVRGFCLWLATTLSLIVYLRTFISLFGRAFIVVYWWNSMCTYDVHCKEILYWSSDFSVLWPAFVILLSSIVRLHCWSVPLSVLLYQGTDLQAHMKDFCLHLNLKSGLHLLGSETKKSIKCKSFWWMFTTASDYVYYMYVLLLIFSMRDFVQFCDSLYRTL